MFAPSTMKFVIGLHSHHLTPDVFMGAAIIGEVQRYKKQAFRTLTFGNRTPIDDLLSINVFLGPPPGDLTAPRVIREPGSPVSVAGRTWNLYGRELLALAHERDLRSAPELKEEFERVRSTLIGPFDRHALLTEDEAHSGYLIASLRLPSSTLATVADQMHESLCGARGGETDACSIACRIQGEWVRQCVIRCINELTAAVAETRY